MNELLDQVVAAYGGREQWEQLRTITAHQVVGGALWGLKQQDGILNDATVTVRLRPRGHCSSSPTSAGTQCGPT